MRAWHTISAIFLGSFLLFGLQPMLSRLLMPAFGGSAAVWTCCLAAYQVLLLAGYGYAHWLAGRSPRPARRLHLALLVLAALWLLGVAAANGPLKGLLGNSSAPTLEILLCVLLIVGLPYVLLAANSALLQAWLARSLRADAGGARHVYALYAVSNLGSLLGLLAYPLLLEPFVPLRAQWLGLSACLLAQALLVAAATARAPAAEAPAPADGSQAPADGLPRALAQPWLWFALPGLSAFMLNAITMHLSTDLLPIPLLWVLLLAAFLLSYIAGFSRAGERGLTAWAALAALALCGSALLDRRGDDGPLLPRTAAGAATLFACGAFLHAWLYRIRPDASRLTRFYLGIAAGGACGGLGASALAPALCDFVLEYPLALALACAACAWLLAAGPLRNHRFGAAALVALLLASAGQFAWSSWAFRSHGLFFGRNFYGCVRLLAGVIRPAEGGAARPVLQMVHGSTLHGAQLLDAAHKQEPTTYYGPQAGGLAILAHPKREAGAPMRVAVIGLGAGTLACYGRTNDVYRFFEINPLVVDLATNSNIFSFLGASPARAEIVPGDARKRLEEERRGGAPAYDVVAVDAYAGDYVPLHLATREALALYAGRLAPGGILALHISNWNIDLLPLCKAAAAELGLQATGVVSPARGALFEARWVLLSRAPLTGVSPPAQLIDWSRVRPFKLPSDERGSLLPLILLNGRRTPPCAEPAGFSAASQGPQPRKPRRRARSSRGRGRSVGCRPECGHRSRSRA